MTSKDILSMISKDKLTSSKVTKPIAPVKYKNVTKSVVNSAPIGGFSSQWRITGTHLLSNVPEKFVLNSQDTKMVKIAAFDLDDTLVMTKSGFKFNRSSSDWQWWHPKEKEPKVVDKIKQLVGEEYTIVIFTNQGAVIAEKTSKSYWNFTNRVNFIEEDLQNKVENLELLVFASTKRPSTKKSKAKANPALSSEEQHDKTRKPNTGMWNQLIEYLQIQGNYEIDMEKSFYVGDAAGRPGDFLDSDKKFAENIGLKKFVEPEEMFNDFLKE